MKKSSDGMCWITRGREIENYLRPALIAGYLTERFERDIVIGLSEDDHLGDAISAGLAGIGHLDYAAAKPAYARKLSELMGPEDLDVLDLRVRLKQVVGWIRKWNHLPNCEGT